MLINWADCAVTLYLQNSLGILSCLDDKKVWLFYSTILVSNSCLIVTLYTTKLFYLCLVASLFSLPCSWTDTCALTNNVLDYASPNFCVVIVAINNLWPKELGLSILLVISVIVSWVSLIIAQEYEMDGEVENEMEWWMYTIIANLCNWHCCSRLRLARFLLFVFVWESGFARLQ